MSTIVSVMGRVRVRDAASVANRQTNGGGLLLGKDRGEECVQRSYSGTCAIAPRDLRQVLVSGNPRVNALLARLQVEVAADSSVLFRGEPGAGKAHWARALHMASVRRNEPFVVVNCATVPRHALLGELFGHERLDSRHARPPSAGRLRQAEGGTIFLDEIESLPTDAQFELQRLLETRFKQSHRRDQPPRVDVRILSATSLDLDVLMSTSEFSRSLYHYLAQLELDVMPLRERSEDVPRLIEQILAGSAARCRISAPAMALLREHSWPGNIRELKHTLHCAIALAQGSEELAVEHFPTLGAQIATSSFERHSTIIPPPPISVQVARWPLAPGDLTTLNAGATSGLLRGSFDVTIRPTAMSEGGGLSGATHAATMLPPAHRCGSPAPLEACDDADVLERFPSSFPTAPISCVPPAIGSATLAELAEPIPPLVRPPAVKFPVVIQQIAGCLWRGEAWRPPEGYPHDMQRTVLRAALLRLAVERSDCEWPLTMRCLRSRLFEPGWSTTEGGTGLREVARVVGLEPTRASDTLAIQALCHWAGLL